MNNQFESKQEYARSIIVIYVYRRLYEYQLIPFSMKKSTVSLNLVKPMHRFKRLDIILSLSSCKLLV